MSTDTQELLRAYEQLPEPQRLEVVDFARFLLSQNATTTHPRETLERWLAGARGTATPGVTTDQVMTRSRGEA